MKYSYFEDRTNQQNAVTPAKPKKSKRLRIVWLLVFLLILFFAAVNVNSKLIKDKFECDSAIGCFKTIVNTSLIEEAKEQSRTLTNQITTKRIVEEESTVIDVIDASTPAVVSIVVRTVGYDLFSGPYASEDGIGTGFVVDSSGVIITNSHVVDDPYGDYSVVLKDGTTYEVEDIHLDQISDLAIIEVTARDLPTLDLGDSDSLRVGQTAIAIGNALGRFDNTVTVGVVSGVARELTASGAFGEAPKTYENVIQTDAALNPGNSGGPLLNSAGDVIGINVATTRGADNIGFAIPANTLKPILASYIENGRIIRPYMGVAYTIITEDISNVRDLPQGAFISRVLTDSPADKAGLERGDIITKINGDEVNSKNNIAYIVNNSNVGDQLDLTVDRAGEVVDLIIELDEAPSANR